MAIRKPSRPKFPRPQTPAFLDSDPALASWFRELANRRASTQNVATSGLDQQQMQLQAANPQQPSQLNMEHTRGPASLPPPSGGRPSPRPILRGGTLDQNGRFVANQFGGGRPPIGTPPFAGINPPGQRSPFNLGELRDFRPGQRTQFDLGQPVRPGVPAGFEPNPDPRFPGSFVASDEFLRSQMTQGPGGGASLPPGLIDTGGGAQGFTKRARFFQNPTGQQTGGGGGGQASPSGFTAFDQFGQIPGFTPTRGGPGNSFQNQVQGQQLTQFGRPITGDPRFADVVAPLHGGPQQPQVPGLDKTVGGGGQFEQGISELQPGATLRPATQRVLDEIRASTERSGARASSEAQALAARRGIEGSTIEQFGVQEALAGASRLGRQQEAEVLQGEAQQELQLSRDRAQGRFGRAQQEAQFTNDLKRVEFEAGVEMSQLFSQLDLQSKMAVSQLTSDELASLRNLSEAGNDRALQQFLGERGIQVQEKNIGLARQQAREQRKSNITGSLIGSVGNIVSSFITKGASSGGGGGGGGGTFSA